MIIPNTSQEAGSTQAAPAPESTPAPETTTTEVVQETPETGGPGFTPEATPPVQPPYQPNLKFKVLDKEMEIDEMFRGLIKDPESEKKVRDIMERAYGIEPVKRQRDEYRDRAKTVEGKMVEIVSTLQEAGAFVQKKDYDSFFDHMNIPKQDIYQWVLGKVEYEKLPPEQKAIWDQRRNAEKQAYTLERENAQLKESQLEQATQARAAELRSVIERPDVRSVMEAVDAKTGRSGSFIEAVIFRGQQAAGQGRDLSAEEAVKEVMALYGPVAPATPQGAPAQMAAQATQPTPPAKTPPTIPNVQGRTQTPVRKQVSSLDDIRKLRDSLGD